MTIRWARRGIAALLTLWSASATAGPLLFGVVPQHSATRLAEMWGPFLAAVSARSGLDIKLATTADIPIFERCLADGVFQVAYMNPFHYVEHQRIAGYRAVAHAADRRLTGILVTRRDSALTTLTQLDGAEIAFPGPNAFGASLLTQAALRSAGAAFTARYVSSHDSVYRTVAAGLIPAGGGVRGTLNALPAGLRDQLTVLYETPPFTPHAFAVRPDVAEADAAALVAAMQSVAREAPHLAQEAGFSGFDAADDAAWNDIRAQGLTPAKTRGGLPQCPFG